MQNINRGSLLYQAKLASQVERFDHVAEFIKEIIELEYFLTNEERNLFHQGYKNLSNSLRQTWRIIYGKETKEQNARQLEILTEFREDIENKLIGTANEVIDLIDVYCLREEEKLATEAKVFYHKMKADYTRYLIEFDFHNENIREYFKKIEWEYIKAMQIGEKEELRPSHPLRLSVALNYSVFTFEMMNNTEGACNIAKKAFDLAVGEVGELDESKYQATVLVMQILRDNITLWKKENVDILFNREDDF